MNFSGNYFQRFNAYPEFIKEKPRKNTKIIVVIPCYDDEMIFDTINSLFENTIEDFYVEIIIVVNSGLIDNDKIKDSNISIYNKLLKIKSLINKLENNIRVYPILIENIKKKFAGVGNARKAGMDEAVRRFEIINDPAGLIVSLDADTKVHKQYFQKILSHFFNNPQSDACTIQFKHNFDETLFSPNLISAAKQYELYLRYFRLALKYSGFPHAIHTIGSCFSVKAIAYVKAGGMSRKHQAGEDFYFLHKITALTNVSEIKEILVYPSPRISERVPFGTGPAIKKIINDNDFKVYNFKAFLIIRDFFRSFNELYHEPQNIDSVPNLITNYLGKEKLMGIIHECKSNTKDLSGFTKRMFSNFNAFFVIRFLNYVSENNFVKPTSVYQAVGEFLIENKIIFNKNNDLDLFDKILDLDCQNYPLLNG